MCLVNTSVSTFCAMARITFLLTVSPHRFYHRGLLCSVGDIFCRLDDGINI